MRIVWMVVNQFLYVLSWLVPRDRKLVALGAWDGQRYCDNPKYLLIHLLEHSEFRCVWIGKAGLKDELPRHLRLEFVEYGSRKAFFRLLRAGTWVFCQNIGDLGRWYVFGGARMYNLWHGIPLKYMGEMTPYARAHRKEKSGLVRLVGRLQSALTCRKEWYTVTASRGMSRIMAESYPRHFALSRILECGTPRNDFLIAHARDERLKADLKSRFARMLGFDPAKKLVLYLPTWRIEDPNPFTFFALNEESRASVLAVLEENDAVLVEKHHHVTLSRSPLTATSRGPMIVVSQRLHDVIDPQELLLAGDVLISDYSGAYVDFALLERPCIHFVYDYDRYKNADSGLAYDLDDVAGGPCVRDFPGLVVALERALQERASGPRPGLKALLAFEQGNACAAICRHMTGG